MTATRSAGRALISVIERDRQRAEARNSSRLLSATLVTVFFVTLLVGLAAGALIYRSVARDQLAADELHLQAGLVANVIRAGDVAGGVREGEGPQGPSLVLERTMGTGVFETRLYHYEGKVLQELAAKGRPYDPANATPLLATSTFSFAIEDGLVSFACDQGSFVVALRCDEGGGR